MLIVVAKSGQTADQMLLPVSHLGFTAGQIPRAVLTALERPYANPAPITEAGLTGLLTRALSGERPA